MRSLYLESDCEFSNPARLIELLNSTKFMRKILLPLTLLKSLPYLLILLLLVAPSIGKAQVALLLEQPYGFFGALNPTGHSAIYMARICADTPLKLRRCNADEMGVVISRYSDIDHHDWIAIPIVPYLYSVEGIEDAPKSVDRPMVKHLRNLYHEQHRRSLCEDLQPGRFFRGGWSQLVGASYERRIYAYRFDTTEAQDLELMNWLNTSTNESHFQLFYNNCSDFARVILNHYFPGAFKRNIFPDAGATTPKKITTKLLKYSDKHPETHLQVFEIPQIPGYRRHSSSNHGIVESLITTGYAIPIVILNPYLAGGLLVDYIVRGRGHLVPKHPQLANADHLDALTAPEEPVKNPTGDQALVSTPITNEKESPSSHE